MTSGTYASNSAVRLQPITRSDVPRVARFLHQHLNERISVKNWTDAIIPPWQVEAPNHGYMLTVGDNTVGVQLAFYSERRTQQGPVRICNVAAFCVVQMYRAHSVRLLRAILAQPGYSFTDLSPSGNVRPLNLRLGFEKLDTSTALVFNMVSMIGPSRARLISKPSEIAATLRGSDLQVFHDHRPAQAAHQLVLVKGERYCHVIFRRDRRKNLPLFATILHVSDPALFVEAQAQVFRYLMLHLGILFSLLELRLVGDRPKPSLLLRGHRPKMFLSDTLRPQAIDYLYSELTCVAW